ncbi:hypothetical protein [Haladaptatus pallidirubidus]|uniref:Uncharacterized protein n=1 Tax=Haladaptatus pallidirubidus TaxID=1008152 RepID=A0AAV3US89_9EURY|nr:hypothetical protein [Haladaptatus pallidirubidus]
MTKQTIQFDTGLFGSVGTDLRYFAINATVGRDRYASIDVSVTHFQKSMGMGD